MTAAGAAALAEATGQPIMATETHGTIGDGIVILREIHRYAGAIADLADAIQHGDGDAAITTLRGGGNVDWIDRDVARRDITPVLEPVTSAVRDAGRGVVQAARAGDARGALEALNAVRLLCAHRRGPYGVATWMTTVEAWLAATIDRYAPDGRWYVGRPLLVTENDYALRLYNGDTGVVVDRGDGHPAAAFERRGEFIYVSPTRLGSVETVHAMTIHKSQGSQFGHVIVVLPDETSPILTRELLYTAVTRAQSHLTVVGPEPSIRAAVRRPIARASGLRSRLWPA
jgi:exodeoxyribonuclease V alpha subunit